MLRKAEDPATSPPLLPPPPLPLPAMPCFAALREPPRAGTVAACNWSVIIGGDECGKRITTQKHG